MRINKGTRFTEGSAQLQSKLSELGLSQGKASGMIGLFYPGMLNRWLHGDGVPSLKFAVELERVFGIPASAWTQEAQQ